MKRGSWLIGLIAVQGSVIVLLVAYAIWSQSLPGLIWTLHSSDNARRAAAAQRLGNMGPEAREALPGLEAALGDDSTLVQSAAASAIAKIGGMPALAEAMKSPNPRARADLLMAMWSIPRSPATDEQRWSLLAAALRDPAPQVRQYAVRALGPMGPAAAPLLPQMSALLYDPDSSVRVAAVDTLDKMGSLEDLAKALSSSDKNVRLAALGDLQHYGLQALPVLTAALENEDAAEVGQAADMLGNLGSPAVAAVPALRRVLGRPEPWLRRRVVVDLERIGGPDAEAALQQAGDDPSLLVRGAALAALQRMKRRAAH
ncbi:MAG TPA: HEAT repeat domain-containing protein [Terriglobales bacterium]|jgi:HEAT repeat protein|nr:HEAT repeat domain-containing protein [Terriglobales bacterium]